MALGNYYPTSSGRVDSHSRQILDFKDGKDEAVTVFSNALITYLRGRGLDKQPVYVATIPSSTAGRSHEGFPQLIQNLAAEFTILNDDHNLIRRTESKQSAHTGGSRRKEDLIATTEVPTSVMSDIQGKSVILFDDVTTTGNSLKAGIDLLSEAGAKIVIAIALGKTTR